MTKMNDEHGQTEMNPYEDSASVEVMHVLRWYQSPRQEVFVVSLENAGLRGETCISRIEAELTV